MKPILLVCAALGSAAIGAATATLITSNRSEPTAQPVHASTPSPSSSEYNEQLAKLTQRIEFLESEQNSLKALGSRAEAAPLPAAMISDAPDSKIPWPIIILAGMPNCLILLLAISR